MSKKSSMSSDETNLFREAVEGIKPLKQDKIQPKPKPIKKKSLTAGQIHKQTQAEFFFSDVFEAHFDQDGPLKYTNDEADSYEVKRLRRGEIPPELILDLHGLTREQAKTEVAALIHEAHKQHYECVCIVHGVGGKVLKTAVPNWLVQHPAIMGFHQAPLEWGGKGALLALVSRKE
ncbi:endonuclease SmrB [Alteromonadaceae bacterium BrNp21-10]|nr:endonuclease SmrB [Alteromonadaceae bacterium BrNp21-10]